MTDPLDIERVKHELAARRERANREFIQGFEDTLWSTENQAMDMDIEADLAKKFGDDADKNFDEARKLGVPGTYSLGAFLKEAVPMDIEEDPPTHIKVELLRHEQFKEIAIPLSGTVPPLDIEAAAREAIEQAGKLPAGPWEWNHVGDQLVRDAEDGPPHYGARLVWDSQTGNVGEDVYLYAFGKWQASARTREPLLAEEVLRLRAWMRSLDDGGVVIHFKIDAALSGAPAPGERA